MDFKKFFLSFFEAVPWVKNLRFILGAVVIGIIALTIWKAWFEKKPANVSNQRVVVTPFAKVEKIDQSSIQVMVEEKTWELGIGVGVLNYDNKNGAFAGVMIKKRW